jgi:ABC-type Na+ efflux pump permease subunit
MVSDTASAPGDEIGDPVEYPFQAEIELDVGIVVVVERAGRDCAPQGGERVRADQAREHGAVADHDRLAARDWLAALGILALFVLALSWFAAAVGIAVRSVEAASGIGFLVSFLAYPSSAFVPIDTMPSWLQGFARNQPVTAVIDSVRALLQGGPVASPAWHALGWSAGIIVGSVVLAGLLFRRRTA